MTETYCQTYNNLAAILDTTLSKLNQAMSVDCEAKDFKRFFYIKQSSLPFLRLPLLNNIRNIEEIRRISIKFALKLPLISKCNVL